jgi:hypothetical protein
MVWRRLRFLELFFSSFGMGKGRTVFLSLWWFWLVRLTGSKDFILCGAVDVFGG